MTLYILDHFPSQLLDISPKEIHTVLDGPTLIHLKGNCEPPLFITTLLHGNELTGFYALQSLMNDYVDRALPRSLSIFIGNVGAAKEDVRHLEKQIDYNRIWAGGIGEEYELASSVLSIMKELGVFVSIDIHNNTGLNPYYACAHILDKDHIMLCKLFSKQMVYFTEPHQVQSRAFSRFCPSIVLECGLASDPKGIEYVKRFLDTCLSLDSLENANPIQRDFKIYHSKVVIKIPSGKSVGFESDTDSVDFRFVHNLESFNFRETNADTLIGWRNDEHSKLIVINEQGRLVGDDYFHYYRHEIRLKKSVIPSMFTKNIAVIYQDCLGYLMEEVKL